VTGPTMPSAVSEQYIACRSRQSKLVTLQVQAAVGYISEPKRMLLGLYATADQDRGALMAAVPERHSTWESAAIGHCVLPRRP